MRLNKALSQIRTTGEQREKIYGDILEKLSEETPENEKETRFVMKRRKILTSVAAAAATVVIVGGTVYAASPEVRETVNNILGINRQSTEEFYEIQNAYINSPAEIEAIEEGVTVTENDFTEFAEGIRAKLVSVVNCGSFAEVLLEFEFDEPVKDGEYGLENLTIDAYPRFLPSYSYGFLRVSDSGKIYSTVRLYDIEKIPEDMTMTMEFTTLDKENSQNADNTDETYADHRSIKINGNFSAKFALGTAIKPTVINIEPAEISWTHPCMGGETAHMEFSGLKYSPKEISVDLRMLEDCLVIYNDEHGEAQYFNCTSMFANGIMSLGESEFNPIKFKMSDGSLKYAQYYDISSNADIDIDKITARDWIKASRDIYSDKPTVVTFQLFGIMDYTDVEAIVFCGVEIPITEKEF